MAKTFLFESYNNLVHGIYLNRSTGRPRRAWLRQIDGIAFGRRSPGTGRAGGQAALNAVEEELVVVDVATVVVMQGSAVVVAAKSSGRGGHRVRRFLDFVDCRQDRLLVIDQATALPVEVTASEQFLNGLCTGNRTKKRRKKIVKIARNKSHRYIYYIQQEKRCQVFGEKKGLSSDQYDICTKFKTITKRRTSRAVPKKY